MLESGLTNSLIADARQAYLRDLINTRLAIRKQFAGEDPDLLSEAELDGLQAELEAMVQSSVQAEQDDYQRRSAAAGTGVWRRSEAETRAEAGELLALIRREISKLNLRRSLATSDTPGSTDSVPKGANELTAAQQQSFERAFGSCRVLAVGVSSQLQESGFISLDVCGNDARDVAAAFRGRRQLNADQTFCLDLALASSLPPTKSVILGHLNKLARDAGPNDRLLFYFSGHGVQLAEELYLVPQDAYAPDDPDSLLAFAEVKKILNESPAKQKLIIIDACHSGPSTTLFKASLKVSKRFLEQYVKTNSGCAILAATESHQRANTRSPDSDHSLMTYYLLNALHGEPTALKDGLLTLYGLHTYLSIEVPRRAKSDNRSTHQTPVLVSSTTGDLILGDFTNVAQPENIPDGNAQREPTQRSTKSTSPKANEATPDQTKKDVSEWVADQFLRSITALRKTGETYHRRLDTYSNTELDLPPAVLADAAERAMFPKNSNSIEWPAVLSRFPEVEHRILPWGARWEYAQSMDRGVSLYEYVAVHQTGRLFLLESQGPHIPQPIYYADDAIGTTYDAIRFCVRFFRNIGLGTGNEVTIRLEWRGLDGYRIASHGHSPDMGFRSPKVCRTNDSVSAEVRFRLADGEHDVADKARQLLVRTFNLFDRYDPSLGVYECVIANWKR